MSTDGQPTAGGQAGAEHADPKAADDREGAFKHRLAREIKHRAPEYEAKGRKALAEELGIDLDNIDQVKEQIAKLPQVVSAEEKARKALEKEKTESATYKQRAEAAEAGLSRHILDSEIRQELSRIGVIPQAMAQVPELVRSRLRVSDGRVTVLDEEGEPSKVTLAKFMEDFVKQNDHFMPAAARRGGAGGRPPNGGDPPPHKLTRDERKQAFNAALAKG